MASVVKNTQEAELSEIIDKIMKIFYKPNLSNGLYCCQPEQIKLIIKLEEDLKTCGGHKLLIDEDDIPKIEIRNCVDREYLPSGTIAYIVTFSPEEMYICIILYYYKTSPLSVNKNFHIS